MNVKIKSIIARALFVGGSPCSGKSTISEFLAEEFNLKFLKIDDYEREHIKRSDPQKQPKMYRFSQMKWDEIWMRPVDLQVEEEFEFYRERFGMILKELNRFSADDTVIMEGAALLPELIRRLDVHRDQVIYLIPSKGFQIEHYAQRGFIKGILAACRKPEEAFENWMDRDHLFGERVKLQAEELGYQVIYVDGQKTINENIKTVSKHFGLG